jgi:hypothetical protein
MAGTIEPTAWHLAVRLFAPRRTRRYAVAVLVVLVCAGLLLSLPSTRQAFRQALVRATPTATVPLAAGADQVYFVQTAPWGHLTLDGTPVASTFGQSLSLPRGQHTLTYTAAPWPPLRCQLSVPEQQDDSCPVDRNMHFGNTPLARAIDLSATADRLPEAQRAALTAVVARVLQMDVETTAVPPGDHYRAADGRIGVARLALQANLVLALNVDATRVASNTVAPGSGSCVSLCSSPDFIGGGGAVWWVVWAHVVAHWRFVAADGTNIDPSAGTDLDAGYQVGATWSQLGAGEGTWSVTLHPYAGTTGDEADLCDPALQQAFPNGNPVLSTSGYSETFYIGPNEIAGCVAVFGPSSGGPPAANATPTPLPADAAIFIARFGMVLAGNDVAHAAQPQFPVASAHERALAQQWMAQPQP